MPKAYSYIRFSTPAQAAGDSFRRQTSMAEAYCKAHGLTLDNTLTFADLGLSGYSGANLEGGAALGRFLALIEAGDIPRGSVLLVEALDRISRKVARKAVRTLEEIVEGGVDVVTLSDGKRYTAESLDGFDFLFAVLLAMRGNEESATKARRLSAAWSAKRRKAATGATLTRLTPGWIRVRDDGERVLIPERAKIVKRIFNEFLAGEGKAGIAKRLNDERVPVFGRGKFWTRSYIQKILANPAVIGTFEPHVEAKSEDPKTGRQRTTRVPQEPVEGYFPAAVDRATFDRAQLRAPDKTNPARPVSHLLAALARCPRCDSTMTRVAKGKRSAPKLVCVTAKAAVRKADGAPACEYHSVSVAAVESAIFDNVEHIERTVPHGDERIQKAIVAAEDGIHRKTRELHVFDDLMASEPSQATARQIIAVQTEIDGLRASLESLKGEATQSDSKLVKARAKRLAAAISSRDVVKANLALRECLNKVVVDYKRGELLFHWRHDGVTELNYAHGLQALPPLSARELAASRKIRQRARGK